MQVGLSPGTNGVSQEESRMQKKTWTTLKQEDRICRAAARSLIQRVVSDESGQIFAWMTLLLMFIFLGLAALSLDVAHAVFVQKELQASADAAALAAAQQLPNGNYQSVGQSYSDAGKNYYAGGVTYATPVVTGLCLNSVTQPPFNSPCSATTKVWNAVQVTESATFHTFFAGILGRNTMTVRAQSTAAGQAGRWNIAIILDTTPSMNFSDPSCGRGLTQLECADNGISTLLAGLDQSADSVSLFTFPAVTVNSTDADTSCGKGGPTVGPYVFPSTSGTSYTSTSTPYVTGSGKGATTTYITYQITPFSNTFQNSGDAMQTAIGNGKCAGMQTSDEYTFLAGAIYAAQDALLGQQMALTAKGISSQNAMVILSDGNATALETSPGGAFNALSNDFLSTSAQVGGGTNYASNSGTYPSWVGQCGQEVDAAQAAATNPGNPTRVYTVAYGSPTTSTTAGYPLGNCESDVGAGQHPNISPCAAMQQMTSNYQSTSNDPYFYSDYNVPGGDSGCKAMAGNQANTDLAGIFNAIRGSLLYTRLIPNNTN